MTKFQVRTAAVLLCVSVAVAIAAPKVGEWRQQKLQGFMAAAQTAEAKGEYSTSLTNYDLAKITSFYSSGPIIAQAQEYEQLGRVSAALHDYRLLPKAQSFEQIGSLESRIGHFSEAVTNFTSLVEVKADAHSYTLLAYADFNNDHIKDGCAAAKLALAYGLGNAEGEGSAAWCNLLSGALTEPNPDVSTKFPGIENQTTNNPRALAYFAIQSGLAGVGESQLLKATPKTPADYSLLAKLRASNSDYPKAIEYARAGSALDPGMLELHQQLANYYAKVGDQANTVHQNYLANLLQK